MRKLLSLLLVLLITTATALAGDPADPAVIAGLLPACTFVEGIDEGDVLRLLMRSAENELVFVGGECGEDGLWRFTGSTPLPEGTSMDDTGALIIPADTAPFTVTLQPYADGTWGVSSIRTGSGIGVRLHRQLIYTIDVHDPDALLGDHPWSDIACIDWRTLPASRQEAAAALDTSRWAVVSSADPLDLVHLREGPSQEAAVLGSYYNGTPVIILQPGGSWCAVRIGSTEGYMMTAYLVNSAEFPQVPSAAPIALPRHLQTQLHAKPSRSSAFVLRQMAYPDSPIILGKTGWWYHVWLPDTDEYGYVHMDDL